MSELAKPIVIVGSLAVGVAAAALGQDGWPTGCAIIATITFLFGL